jgi:hypothetical protein
VILPVYFRNWRSIMAIKRLGSTLLGADEDNFLHYELTTLAAKYRPIVDEQEKVSSARKYQNHQI